jgi:hypothetical protein
MSEEEPFAYASGMAGLIQLKNMAIARKKNEEQ